MQGAIILHVLPPWEGGRREALPQPSRLRSHERAIHDPLVARRNIVVHSPHSLMSTDKLKDTNAKRYALVSAVGSNLQAGAVPSATGPDRLVGRHAVLVRFVRECHVPLPVASPGRRHTVPKLLIMRIYYYRSRSLLNLG